MRGGGRGPGRFEASHRRPAQCAPSMPLRCRRGAGYICLGRRRRSSSRRSRTEMIQLQTQLLEAQELIVRGSEMLEHQVRVAAQPGGPPGIRPRTQGLVNQLHRWPAQWGLEDKRLGRVYGRCRRSGACCSRVGTLQAGQGALALHVRCFVCVVVLCVFVLLVTHALFGCCVQPV
jgi:hypothetical protein